MALWIFLPLCVLTAIFFFLPSKPKPQPVTAPEPIVEESPPPAELAEPEEEPSLYTCPNDWTPFVMSNMPLAFCAPNNLLQPTEYGSVAENHLTFSTEESPELVLTAAEVENEFVDFPCLLDSSSDAEFQSCFGTYDKVLSHEEFTLATGQRAFVAHVEVRKLEGEARYVGAYFLLVPSVADSGIAFDLEIGFEPAGRGVAEQMASHIFPAVKE